MSIIPPSLSQSCCVARLFFVVAFLLLFSVPSCISQIIATEKHYPHHQYACLPFPGQDTLGATAHYRQACPDYKLYSASPHEPLSTGPLALPYQRPAVGCRTFISPYVEQVISNITTRMKDPDLARIFENAFPNTLDTTVRWHLAAPASGFARPSSQDAWPNPDRADWDGSQSFIVTGDIDAEWLRDSANQLAAYMPLANQDPALFNLLLGAINTQTAFVIDHPYCNAFQPPSPSGLNPADNGQSDTVSPPYDPTKVFECKFELDSLAAFLKLSSSFYRHTKSSAFITKRWLQAIKTVLSVIDAQSEPTFDVQGRFKRNPYSFQRLTNLGTETLNLAGIGNPLANGTGLIRSAFRPSDDATIFGFFIPANAMMAVELERTAAMLREINEQLYLEIASLLTKRASAIRVGILQHGVVDHPNWGRVYAFEVDGYGSCLLMDDANAPSLLSLPLLGFVDIHDRIYQNTRAMILSQQGNPYFLVGPRIQGIGGPHVGLDNAWPMSMIFQAATAIDDDEIMRSLTLLKNTSSRGLINESVNIHNTQAYTRSWFAWGNSEFAQLILSLAKKRPHILFGHDAEAYDYAEQSRVI